MEQLLSMCNRSHTRLPANYVQESYDLQTKNEVGLTHIKIALPRAHPGVLVSYFFFVDKALIAHFLHCLDFIFARPIGQSEWR
jgi:hypothetical protein